MGQFASVRRRGVVKVEREATSAPSNDVFGRLTQLVASNDRLLKELADLDLGLGRADAYLASSSPNMVLGRAYRDFLKVRKSKVLTILRANRVAAREFLSR